MDSGPYFDPDYETLSAKINPPRVVVDNSTSDKATLIKVDSVNTHGVLLEVVQVLSELDLCINKAYISSDGGWFMDVFHVTDRDQNKVTDEVIIKKIMQSIVAVLSMLLIMQSLGAEEEVKRPEARTFVTTPGGRKVAVKSVAKHTAIELTGTDRPGLLSEISAVLSELGCNVNQAEVWTHNMRVACVVYVTDEKTGGLVEDLDKQARIRELLCNVMKGKDDRREAKTEFSTGLTNTDRRLHQMMFADRDYEAGDVQPEPRDLNDGQPIITIQLCKEKGYSIVNVESGDRPKLLFDTVCTLTDMEYVVFHATISSENGCANQEYYIRHRDGQCLDSEAEKNRVIKCLEAAIARRVSDGLKLELCTSDRVGLLSEVTRIFRENGLSVARADVETRDEKAVNVFYVTDASGNSVDKKRVDDMRRAMQVGTTKLDISEVPRLSRSPPNEPARGGFSLSSLLRSQSERFLYNLGSFGWARSV